MVRIAFVIVLVLQIVIIPEAFAEGKRFYLGLNAGANILTGSTENTSSLGSFNLEYKPGYQGNLTLGYHLAQGSILGKGRIELEVGYRQNSVDKIEFSDGKFSADGEAIVWDVMVNTFGEYSNKTRWTPYFGAGFGVAIVSLDGVEVAGTPVVDDEDSVFAYQLGFGADYALSKKLTLDFGYRFFGTSKPALTDVTGAEFDTEYQVHNLQVGVRF